MNKSILLILTFFAFFVQESLSQCPGANINISATTVTAECLSDGSMTISASGGQAPYIYDIEGPLDPPPQNSPTFNALQGGNYTVTVTDNLGNCSQQVINVPTTYVPMNISVSGTISSCPEATDGELVVNVTGGSPDYSYSLTSPSPILAGPQASNQFTNLVPGLYRVQVEDDCQVINSFEYTLNSFYDGTYQPYCEGCCLSQMLNCTEIGIDISDYLYQYNSQNPTPIVSYAITSGQQTFPAQADPYFEVPAGGDYVFEITDECGETFEVNLDTDPRINVGLTDSCGKKTAFITHCYVYGPVTYALIAGPNAGGGSQSSQSFPLLDEGTHTVAVIDGCNDTTIMTFSVINIDSDTINAYAWAISPNCDTNLMDIYFNADYATYPLTFMYLSGPTDFDTVQGPEYYYSWYDQLTGLEPGTYEVIVSDVCLKRDTVTVTADTMPIFGLSYELTYNCQGNGNLENVVMENNAGVPYPNNYVTGYLTDVQGNVLTPSTYYPTNYYNLIAGTYIHYMSHYYCPQLSRIDTIIVPPQIDAGALISGTMCNNNSQGQLFVVPKSGVPPYTYQIISGPLTTAVQDTNFFSSLPQGIYQVRIVDDCGNSDVVGYSLVPYGTENLTASGTVCEGQVLNILADTLPYANYTWTLPNDSIIESRKLTIDSITDADTGTYQLQVHYNTCLDTTLYIDINYGGDLADFTSTDMCGGDSNVINIQGVGGGVFSFNPLPADAATIDSTTGIITNASLDSTYIIQYLVQGALCPSIHTQEVSVIPTIDPTFTTSDFCYGDTNEVIVLGNQGGIFYLETPISNGEVFDDQTGEIFNADTNITYVIKYIVGNGTCIDSSTNSIMVHVPVMASFTTSDVCENGENEVEMLGNTGGVFELTSPPGPGVLFDSLTGVISNANINDASYTINYILDENVCKDSSSVSISVIPLPDPTFSASDFCVQSQPNIQVFGDNGGNYSFNPLPVDGATIDPLDGEITGALEGSVYNIYYTVTINGCTDSMLQTIEVVSNTSSLFTSDDFCEGTTNQVTVLGTNGGTFALDVPMGDTATIDSSFGNILGGMANAQYTITYTSPGVCGSSYSLDIEVIPQEISLFTVEDFCFGDTNSVTVEGTLGGSFSFSPQPLDNAQIDITSGSISDVTEGEIYTIMHKTSGACPDSSFQNVEVLTIDDPSFTTSDMCYGYSNQVEIVGSSQGTFSFAQEYNDGSIINSITGEITGGQSGEAYQIQYLTSGVCPDSSIQIAQVVETDSASFITNDFCYGEGNSVEITGLEGGVFSLVEPFNTANINASTGEIFNVQEGGNYVIKYVTTGSCPDSSFESLHVFSLPVADFVIPSICLSNSFSVVNNSLSTEGQIISWDWTFGDGTSSSLENPEHTYYSTGNFLIQLQILDDNGCSVTDSMEVIVNPLPEINFSAPSNCFESPTIFENLSTIDFGSITQFYWNFGDGQTSPLQSPEYNYLTAGSFDVQLIGTSNVGCSDSSMNTVTIFQLPQANFDVDKYEGCEGTCFEFFDQSGSGGANIVSWNWNLGDSDTSGVTQTSYCYPNSGYYDIGLIVLDENQCSDTLVKDSLIEVFVSPIADLSIEEKNPEIPGNVAQIFDLSMNADQIAYLIEEEWQTNSASSFSYIFEESGTYIVTQVVETDKGCIDSAQVEITFEPDFGIYLPNTFTPNEDYVNEYFFPKGYGMTSKDYQFRIFNRWGDLIWEASSLEDKWDGKDQNSEVVPQGIYNYKLQVIDVLNDIHHFEGPVNVIR